MDEKFMDFYTKAEINAMLGGLSFCKMTKEEYDALPTKDENKIYFVSDENGNVVQYFGYVQLGGGAAPTTTRIPQLDPLFAGKLETVEMNENGGIQNVNSEN